MARLAVLVGITLLGLIGCATGTAADRVARYCQPYPPSTGAPVLIPIGGITYNWPYPPRNLYEARCVEAIKELQNTPSPWPESPWVCRDGTRQCPPEERTRRLMDKGEGTKR